MPYSNTIPAATDELKNSQSDLLANFEALEALIEVNHLLGTFDSPIAGDTGKHSQVMMPENAAPDVAGANEASIFCNVGPVSAITELFFQREAGVISTPLTEQRNYTIAGDDGFFRVGGGNLLVRFNKVTGLPAATFFQVNYTGLPGPAYLSTPVVFVTPRFTLIDAQNVSVTISDSDINGFRVYSRNTLVGGVFITVGTFDWISVGRVA